jgi:hypothetical protein
MSRKKSKKRSAPLPEASSGDAAACGQPLEPGANGGFAEPSSSCPDPGDTDVDRPAADERTGYHGVRTLHHAGIRKGREFTHISFKRTACVACGQARVDRFYEFRPNLGQPAL